MVPPHQPDELADRVKNTTPGKNIEHLIEKFIPL
jgi:hypothetical protein